MWNVGFKLVNSGTVVRQDTAGEVEEGTEVKWGLRRRRWTAEQHRAESGQKTLLLVLIN